MVVTLIGMKHCGKTTLGTVLAARWGCAFYDVDQMIEERHACMAGEHLPVREIFKREGEQRFHELETQVVCDLYLRLSDATDNSVVAVGGRTALNTKVDELLTALGLIVYLEVSPAEMFARVQRGGLPPFVDEKDATGHFAKLYAKRTPQYRRLANLTVNLDGLGIDAAFQKFLAALESHVARQANQGKGPHAGL